MSFDSTAVSEVNLPRFTVDEGMTTITHKNVQPEAPGIVAGARTLFTAFGFLLETKATWPAALVPAAVLLGLLTGVGWASVQFAFPAIQASLPSGSGQISGVLWSTTSGLIALAVFVLGAMLALALTPPLCGPALEKIVALREHALGAPERRPIGFWAEIWCGFRAQIFVLLWLLPVLVALWLADFIAPPAAVLTTPLKLIVTSLALAWNLLDYPLTLRGVRMRERFLLIKRFKGACLGFGAAFAVLFWIPCGCQIVMLPVGAAAATDLVWQLLGADRTLLPELGRVSEHSAPARADVSVGAERNP